MNLLLAFIAIFAIILLCRNYKKGNWPFRGIFRKKIFTKGFPQSWLGIIKKNVPVFKSLPETLKTELKGHINVFLTEKNFEGCGGLKINDEIRLTIAANACLLLLNRKASYFPKLDSILVYPSSYVVKDTEVLNEVHIEENSLLDGESWDTGTIVLAWDSVKRSANDSKDGYNLVLHEFAHQLDLSGFETMKSVVKDSDEYISFAKTFTREFKRFRRDVKNGKRLVLDEYGADDPFEFFSVATEAFFEKPAKLRSKMPDLYRELSKYYNLDPVSWG